MSGYLPTGDPDDDGLLVLDEVCETELNRARNKKQINNFTGNVTVGTVVTSAVVMTTAVDPGPGFIIIGGVGVVVGVVVAANRPDLKKQECTLDGLAM